MPIAGAGLGRGMLCVHVATVEAILAVSNPCLFYALAVYALSARSAGSPVSTLIAFSLTMLLLTMRVGNRGLDPALVDALGGVCESVLLAYVVAGVTIGLVLGTPGVLGFGLGRFWVAI